MGHNAALVVLACVAVIADESCRDGAREHMRSDCHRFRYCKAGEWLELTCPPSRRVFDPLKRNCVSTNDYQCREVQRGFSSETCEEGMRYPSDDCRKYELCVSGKKVKMSCGISRTFNPADGKCGFSWPWQACTSQLYKYKCLEGRREDIDCHTYVKCDSGVWKIQECKEGEGFDGKDCAKGVPCTSETTTTIRPTHEEISTDETNPTSTETESSTITTIIVPTTTIQATTAEATSSESNPNATNKTTVEPSTPISTTIATTKPTTMDASSTEVTRHLTTTIKTTTEPTPTEVIPTTTIKATTVETTTSEANPKTTVEPSTPISTTIATMKPTTIFASTTEVIPHSTTTIKTTTIDPTATEAITTITTTTGSITPPEPTDSVKTTPEPITNETTKVPQTTTTTTELTITQKSGSSSTIISTEPIIIEEPTEAITTVQPISTPTTIEETTTEIITTEVTNNEEPETKGTESEITEVPTTTTEASQCKTGLVKPDFSDCSKYYECSEIGIWEQKSCIWFWYFDSHSLKCKFFYYHCAKHFK